MIFKSRKLANQLHAYSFNNYLYFKWINSYSTGGYWLCRLKKSRLHFCKYTCAKSQQIKMLHIIFPYTILLLHINLSGCYFFYFVKLAKVKQWVLMLLPCHLALEHFGGSEKSLNLVHVTDLKKERKILIALTDDIEKKEAKALFFAIPFIIMAKCTSSPMLYIYAACRLLF